MTDYNPSNIDVWKCSFFEILRYFAINDLWDWSIGPDRIFADEGSQILWWVLIASISTFLPSVDIVSPWLFACYPSPFKISISRQTLICDTSHVNRFPILILSMFMRWSLHFPEDIKDNNVYFDFRNAHCPVGVSNCVLFSGLFPGFSHPIPSQKSTQDDPQQNSHRCIIREYLREPRMELWMQLYFRCCSFMDGSSAVTFSVGIWHFCLTLAMRNWIDSLWLSVLLSPSWQCQSAIADFQSLHARVPLVAVLIQLNRNEITKQHSRSWSA
jgi:hypothetical protein